MSEGWFCVVAVLDGKKDYWWIWDGGGKKGVIKCWREKGKGMVWEQVVCVWVVVVFGDEG